MPVTSPGGRGAAGIAAGVLVVLGVAAFVIVRDGSPTPRAAVESPTSSGVTTTVPSAPTTTSAPPSSTSVVSGTTTTTTTSVEPADARFPAAGACVPAGGSVGNVAFNDQDFVPEPRCLIVHGNQRLSVTNRTAARLDVVLGANHQAGLAPNETYVFPGTVGTYLARGVHFLRTPAGSADIWVDPTCTGPGGGPPCSTP